jgi:hypothetical protein
MLSATFGLFTPRRKTMTRLKLCPCGSGNSRYDLLDAAGIFLAFVCGDCEDNERSKWTPTIFDSRSRYAVTGEEEDIWDDDDRD